jgi:hypothetical protein
MRSTLRSLFLLAFTVAASLGAIRWILHEINAARESVRQWRPTNTATGYRFPAISEITAIEVRGWCHEEDGDRKETDFNAVRESWTAILRALSPSELDPEPCAWQAIGALRIRTIHGQNSCVNLFSWIKKGGLVPILT